MAGFDDTPESDNSWRGDTSWAIAPRKRKRRAGDEGPDRQALRVLTQHFKWECQARRDPCWLCGNPIDYHARSGPRAFELDHAIPVSHAPKLVLEPSDFKPAHSLCNRRRQASEVTSLLGEPSEAW